MIKNESCINYIEYISQYCQLRSIVSASPVESAASQQSPADCQSQASDRYVARYVDPQLVGPRWTDGPMDRACELPERLSGADQRSQLDRKLHRPCEHLKYIEI